MTTHEIESLDRRPLRLPSLTSLRWFAATAVFLHHANGTLVTWAPFSHVADQGSSGVSFFFVLSGFVLAWSRREGASVTDFYRRRVARIVPAYLFASVVGSLLLYLLGQMSTRQLLAAPLSFTMLQAWVPSSQVAATGIGVTWSVSAEALFYLIFPAFVGAAVRLSNRRLKAVLVLAAGSSMLIPLVVHPSANNFWYWFVYLNPGVRALEFITGVCLGLFLQRGVRVRVGVRFASALALAAYLVAGWVPPFAQWYAITLVPFALLIFTAAQGDVSGSTPALLSARSALDLGTWSYSFYLVHLLVIACVSKVFEVRGSLSAIEQVGSFGLAYVGSIVMGFALWRFVEHPAEARLRPRERRPLSA